MNTGSILLIAFISAAVGYAVGLFLTRSSNKPKDPNLVEDAENGPRYEIHRLSVTLWSKTPHGPLMAEMYGRSFNTRDDVPEPEKNRLINDIRTIEAWFGLTSSKPVAAAIPAPVSAPEVPSATAPAETPTPAALPAEPKPAAPAPAAPPPAPRDPNVEVDLKDLTEAELAKIMPPEPIAPVPPRIDAIAMVKKEPAPKSIVEQINDILQDKIKNTAYSAEGIKLQETPQGVLVWIGKQSFQGIDSVPDGEAKLHIRAAVKEWENK